MSFSIHYGNTVFTNKVAEMGEPFCKKLSVNKNFIRTKNVSETMGETASTVVNKCSYRMCAKIKKYVKILLLEFLNENYILYFFLVQNFFF